jgi:penicillin amidase
MQPIEPTPASPISPSLRPAAPVTRPRRRLSRFLYSLLALLLLLILLILLAFVGLHQRMRASMPQLDGTLQVAGLHATVKITRDAQGVPYIQAQSVDDLLFAQGFVTASDRLWQMDMARRLPAGEAAAVLGSKLVPHDRVERTLGIRDVAAHLAATLPPQQLQQLQDYANGVNAYIAQAEHTGKLPPEFALLVYKPARWQPEDSLLVALSMSEMLDERWQAKLKREQLTAHLAQHGDFALAADLFPVGSWRDHPPVPSTPAITDPQVIPQVPLDPSQLGAMQARPESKSTTRALLALSALTEAPCLDCRPGSNEWAVSGAHTASGMPILSNDMHLEHQIPDIWYESGLEAPGFHAAGVTIPGLPFIAAGHNQHIAWGFTALGGDTQDVYVEHLDKNGQYLVKNADGSEHWQPLTHEQETIVVRGGRDIPIDVERTDHGPLLSGDSGHGNAGLLPGERRALSLHWTLYDAQTQGLPLYALDTASDWTSFRAALASWWAPTLNVAYADDQGHIGYQAVGYIPIRAGGLQAVPVPFGALYRPASGPASGPAAPSGTVAVTDTPESGTATATDSASAASPAQAPATPLAGAAQRLGSWQGYIPFKAMPSVLDPEGGIIATANARVSPDGYPYQITLEWAAPYRNERIWKWLNGKQKLTPADMLKLQTDIYSESDQDTAQRLVYAIDHSSNATKRERAAADILRSWNGVVSTDSAAAAIVVSTQKAFWPAVLEPKVGKDWHLYDWSSAAYAREEFIAQQPARWLPGAYANWNDFLAALVGTAVKQAPSQLQKWQYGSIHTIEVTHPLWGLLPTFDAGVGPAPLAGDPSTVQQSTGNLGPSQRFTTQLGNPDATFENLVVGQSGNLDSPYFRNQWPAWYKGTTFALPFSDAAVAAAARHTLEMQP